VRQRPCVVLARRPASDSKLTVAAAANLVNVLNEVGCVFKANTGIDAVFSIAPRMPGDSGRMPGHPDSG
jgi:hypothetical protein